VDETTRLIFLTFKVQETTQTTQDRRGPYYSQTTEKMTTHLLIKDKQPPSHKYPSFTGSSALAGECRLKLR
jgi:hypothetical protein